MATPERDSLADGLVNIGTDAIAKSNDTLLDDNYTDDYKLHSPAGTFNRDEIKAYFAALRESFTDFTISRAQSLVDGNFVSSRTVMTGRLDKEFAYTPIGSVEPNGKQVQWELTVSARAAGFIAAHAGTRRWVEILGTLADDSKKIVELASSCSTVITLSEPSTRTVERVDTRQPQAPNRTHPRVKVLARAGTTPAPVNARLTSPSALPSWG